MKRVINMSWKDDYEKAVKEYFGIPLDAKITVENDCYYYEGCPTCGGDYDFSVTVYYYKDGKGSSHTYSGKMTEFLADLPN